MMNEFINGTFDCFVKGEIVFNIMTFMYLRLDYCFIKPTIH